MMSGQELQDRCLETARTALAWMPEDTINQRTTKELAIMQTSRSLHDAALTREAVQARGEKVT